MRRCLPAQRPQISHFPQCNSLSSFQSLKQSSLLEIAPSDQTPALQKPEPVKLQALQTTQPPAFQGMDPRKPHPDTELSLRGGAGYGREICPGTFCCIPCPIPCHFCIIPC
ncbi:hypothetical protein QBC34DRAFT_408665 [Podospora aff. communis PSN243]|uniref:Cysteine-rich transmembrane CYSTM domain-containing protein n=1 Tax=Podospora aff. communis PSN243 TaxID=3040156 RepID=A0AAV9GHP8_9PEZI|nr:hypothetical protein QBC34DRAFT_408665 [Podospora aff. communis PSN243]